MPDIFISYSSHDREQAELLTELLASAGLSVWIDQSALNAASSWSKEIVEAINGCKVFVVLLSPASLDSHNVIKEVALASEKRKKILPLDLEPVALTSDFEYQLAGIQRAPMTNIDSIIRALGKLGLEATGAPQAPKIVREQSDKKSLMILPFEDLSPTADNGWFADGIVSELISSLSNIKSLTVTDPQTTKDFKQYRGTLPNYAREMSIRYFVNGDVRKFGDNIKITARLLDIDTGDYLWQDSIKATMADIFEVQEQVANKVVEGLKLHLTGDEKKKLAERGTENAEAYELQLKAREYFVRGTKESTLHAIEIISEALLIDPNYAEGYRLKALALSSLYRVYDRNPVILGEAESCALVAQRLDPSLVQVYAPLMDIYMLQGKISEAEAVAREFIRKAPNEAYSHTVLGHLYYNLGEPAKAIAPWEEAVNLAPESLVNLTLLTQAYGEAGELEKCKALSLKALSLVARQLRLNPDDETSRSRYAQLLINVGRDDEIQTHINILKRSKDGRTLYNTACLLGNMGDAAQALETFRMAINEGFRSSHHITAFLNETLIVQLASTPEYEEVKRMVEEIEREQVATKNG